MTQASALASSSEHKALANPDGLPFENFRQVLTALTSVLPYAKPLGEEAWLLLWLSFPEHAKLNISPDMWAYAAAQRLMDPNPPKEVAIHLQLLRYIYRLENGMPNLQWGIKHDLYSRMAAPDTFHPEPRSLADRIATEGTPNLDGNRHEPAGVLTAVEWVRDPAQPPAPRFFP
jgi:hypothetical protein